MPDPDPQNLPESAPEAPTVAPIPAETYVDSEAQEGISFEGVICGNENDEFETELIVKTPRQDVFDEMLGEIMGDRNSPRAHLDRLGSKTSTGLSDVSPGELRLFLSDSEQKAVIRAVSEYRSLRQGTMAESTGQAIARICAEWLALQRTPRATMERPGDEGLIWDDPDDAQEEDAQDAPGSIPGT
jgi:hypothetical protein